MRQLFTQAVAALACAARVVPAPALATDEAGYWAFADQVQVQSQRLQGLGARVRCLRGNDATDKMLGALLDLRRAAA